MEYDRLTLRPWDYLNFFPAYIGSGLSKRVDMPGAEFLSQQGVPLLIDRFPYPQQQQSMQLLQRGIRWTTLESSLRGKFMGRPVKEVFDEWQMGFSMTEGIGQANERDVVRALADPRVRYLDFFTGDYDQAHLTPDHVSQLHTLESLDALVGRLSRAIEASPLAARTALVLVSDHGMNTAEAVYGQGYNLVDWFNSRAGGGHHVITNRHPLTEFKIKALDPFVSEVITPSRQASYLAGAQENYPTVVLDLDGNERANIALRENTLNIVHILIDQLVQKRVNGALRVAALNALFQELERARPLWGRRLTEMEDDLQILRDKMAEEREAAGAAPRKTSKQDRDLGLDKDARRVDDRLGRWREEERADTAYAAVMHHLLRLKPDDFDPGNFKIEEAIPRKSLGELNSIYDLQNYVVGPAEGGLVLGDGGALDRAKSFRTVNYFSALSLLRVRNHVQKDVSSQPVDFIAVRVAKEALRGAFGDTSLEDGIWLWKSAERQGLLLRRADAKLRYVPVAQLAEDRQGVLHFDRAEWAAGFPLELFEDANVTTTGDRAEWLAQWHDEREWFRTVHRSQYSNAIVGLTEQLLDAPAATPQALDRRARLRTDLLVFANDHWNFNVRGFNPGGNHGSLLRTSTHSVFMVTGGKDTGLPRGLRVETPYDSLSFAPTILRLLGKPEPDLPGPLLQELLAQPGQHTQTPF